ncbi:hypothetical protein NDU88_002322 [Pleurodeles waltl]|uniref:Uncharacterized protein n=1 Tax=Pleurodeles waltl TaxID=8319 RepID=A0AAV7TKV4_PLEWA|nr:hypothetical protein NDU88_002322 [Pleurodeles waltl]
MRRVLVRPAFIEGGEAALSPRPSLAADKLLPRPLPRHPKLTPDPSLLHWCSGDQTNMASVTPLASVLAGRVCSKTSSCTISIHPASCSSLRAAVTLASSMFRRVRTTCLQNRDSAPPLQVPELTA